ncbi:MAG: response regulator [Deltaproteobacteria bacterium]|jgi:putative two-component system response regulator|nr:response regulator [Deltaproteobacteria bacterium]
MDSEKKQILVVDDNISNLKYISAQLSDIYKVTMAKSGPQALQIAAKQNPDLVLLDIDMPEMDGFETLARMREDPQLNKLPVIFLSANNDPKTEVKALQVGAMDFIPKPFEKSILTHRLNIHLKFSKYQSSLENTVRELEDSIVTSFSELIEARDENTGGHVKRTSAYVDLLGKALIKRGMFESDLNPTELDLIVRAAPLHDIGKIGISDLILMKKGRLTTEEYETIKKHTVIGADVLRSIYEKTPTQAYLRYAILIAEGHHERFDGSGYPYQIKGESIDLCNRIMSVANVYDSLVTDRVYRPALGYDEAKNIILESSGKEFDPKIVEVFAMVHQDFVVIAEQDKQKVRVKGAN